jgi:hypothetical protein
MSHMPQVDRKTLLLEGVLVSMDDMPNVPGLIGSLPVGASSQWPLLKRIPADSVEDELDLASAGDLPRPRFKAFGSVVHHVIDAGAEERPYCGGRSLSVGGVPRRIAYPVAEVPRNKRRLAIVWRLILLRSSRMPSARPK